MLHAVEREDADRQNQDPRELPRSVVANAEVNRDARASASGGDPVLILVPNVMHRQINV
jgi:hypothetical protein